MRILLRAAIAAASFASIAPAHSAVANPYASETVGAGRAHVMRAYVTESKRGTWLFAPHDGGGANS